MYLGIPSSRADGEADLWATLLPGNFQFPEDVDWVLRRIKRVRFGTWESYAAGLQAQVIEFDKQNAWIWDRESMTRDREMTRKIGIIPVATLENMLRTWAQVLRDAEGKPDGTEWEVEFE